MTSQRKERDGRGAPVSRLGEGDDHNEDRPDYGCRRVCRVTRASETAEVGHDKERDQSEGEENGELRVGVERDRRSERRRHKQCGARCPPQSGEPGIPRHTSTKSSKCVPHRVSARRKPTGRGWLKETLS